MSAAPSILSDISRYFSTREPLVGLLCRQGGDQPKRRILVGEDAYHFCSALNLLVKPFQEVCRSHPLAVRLRQIKACKKAILLKSTKSWVYSPGRSHPLFPRFPHLRRVSTSISELAGFLWTAKINS